MKFEFDEAASLAYNKVFRYKKFAAFFDIPSTMSQRYFIAIFNGCYLLGKGLLDFCFSLALFCLVY